MSTKMIRKHCHERTWKNDVSSMLFYPQVQSYFGSFCFCNIPGHRSFVLAHEHDSFFTLIFFQTALAVKYKEENCDDKEVSARSRQIQRLEE